MSNIKARLLKGFRDLLPCDAIIKEKFLSNIKNTFENYGFSPIYTPALEYIDILTGKGGDENEKLMYRFQDNGQRDVGMRYDLTVPLARFVALHKNELNFPFKRYHIAPVWRAENTQKGRYREFYQCDCDIVGSDSVLSDVEIVSLINNTLSNLKIEDFLIKINSRVFVDFLFNIMKLDEEGKKKTAILMDKKDKLPIKVFDDELEKLLNNEQINIINEYFLIDNIDSLQKFMSKLEIIPDELKNEIDKFKKIFEYCLFMNKHLKFDPLIIRGLDYYTGIVFETVLVESPQYGAIFSGGRYDGLVSLFTGEKIPAIGASIGISRLITALEERDFFGEKKNTVSDVIIFNLDEKIQSKYLDIACIFRKENIKTDIYHENAKMKKQFKYAEKNGYRFAVIIGEDENEKNILKLKDLKNFSEKEMSLENAVREILSIL